MVSIKDVAKHAGVAISTVSKVLNHYPNVSEETRQKVNTAVKELHFVPNSVAAALSSKQAGRVALLVNLNVNTQAIDEIDMQYIQGALNQAMQRNLDVITLFTYMFQNKSTEELERYLLSQSITGIIIFGISKEDFVIHELIARGTFKCVVIDAPIVNSNTSSVSIDHVRAQYDVARKTLIENSCKKVLYIAGKKNGYVTDERILGMQKLGEEMHLKIQIRYGDFSEKKARDFTIRYARAFDAVVCASDLMAIGAMKALIEMDIFRPVCGFDGVVLMGYVGKQMNTVRQDFAGIASKAMEELSRLLGGEAGRALQTPYTLVRMKYEDIIC